MGQVKEENEKIVSVITGLIEKLQEEREGETATEPKKKGVCFICNDPGHYAPDCPKKKERKPAGMYNSKGGGYYQKGNKNAAYHNPIKYHPTSRMENQNRTVPPLQRENRTVTVTTVGNRDIGHRNAQSKTFPHSIRSSGMI